MINSEENAKVVLEAIEDLLTGKKELSHMTGDFELCGTTADNVLRQIKEEEREK